MEDDAIETLPDLLAKELDVVFVGINPSLYSVARGHYFARKTNRFWPSLSRSVLSAKVREALGVELLLPEHDSLMTAHGIGFTDVVKRPTGNASMLGREEFAAGVAELHAKLRAYRPRVACFHGVTGYRPFAAVLGAEEPRELGLQALSLGATRVFVVPNPSPANAHSTPVQQTVWYDRLAAVLQTLG